MPTDVAELARLRWDSQTDVGSAHSRSEFLRECEMWLRDALASHHWVVAVADSGHNTLVGCMFLQCVEKVPVPGDIRRAWGYITNSYVEPQQRGRGTGQQLLQLLVEAGRSRDLELLIVWPSEGAVTLYRRAGFQPVSDAHAGGDDQPPMELMFPLVPAAR